ncbi:MAG: hypothetical protein ABR987_02800 [Terracidiphilus sp.]|jgi:hypothetical protein
MKKVFAILGIALAACAVAHAQVAPAANAGPASFGYSVNYAQSAEFGSGLEDWQTIMLNGSINYTSGFERAPFSVSYAGGYTWTISGPAYSSGYFQHVVGTQALNWRRFKVIVSDNVSFLPQAPVTGFAGVPGTGQPVGTPNPAPTSQETVLTLNTRSLDNFLDVSIVDRLSLGTSFNASGGWGILRYPDGNGISVNSEVGSAGLSQRLNARMKLNGTYSYSQFGYPDYALSFQSNTISAGFNRNWNRRFSTTFSGGPQWVSSSDSAQIPSSINFAIDASTGYTWRNISSGLTYQRGVSGGAGYLLGAHSDVVSGNVSRGFFGRGSLTVGLQGSYRRIAGLNNSGVVSSEDIGVQANKRLGQHLSTFIGYSVINQGFSGALPTNVLGTTLQSLSFGFGYLPREARIIH